MESSFKVIENLRKSAGTLPSENPKKINDFLNIENSLEVKIEDHNLNPYKAMFVTSTATWGDNTYADKWKNTLPEGKLEVVKAVLTGNTLPQAREMVNFIFKVRGVPRWLFDRHTQVSFTTFMSIGCRDNNKLDSDFIFQNEKIVSADEKETLNQLKNLYEYIITKGEGSWQSARSFLPQCYQHSYFFGQNLLSISAIKFNKNDEESKMLKYLYKNIVDKISEAFPLIGYHASQIFTDRNIIYKNISELKYSDLSVLDKKYFEEII
jgi:hypothetical protein